MFEKFFDLLEKLWSLFTPYAYCHAWQGGVVMRVGAYNRPIGPGLHWANWKWPIVEDYQVTETAITTVRLPPQSLTTKDDKQVVVSMVIRYRISDVEKFICSVWDARDVLIDTALGAVGNSVIEHTYDELMHANPERAILEEVRKGTREFGIKILATTFGDRTKGRSLRLVMPHPKDLDN